MSQRSLVWEFKSTDVDVDEAPVNEEKNVAKSNIEVAVNNVQDERPGDSDQKESEGAPRITTNGQTRRVEGEPEKRAASKARIEDAANKPKITNDNCR